MTKPAWPLHPSIACDRDERRWSQRYVVRVPIILRAEDGEACPATILDMSDEGLMIALDPAHPVTTFTTYSIAVEGFFQCQCFAVWRDQNMAGLIFSLPIHRAVVEALARRFPARLEDL